MNIKKLISYTAILLSIGTVVCKAQDKVNAQDVISTMKKSADWHMVNPMPNMSVQEWHMAAYLDGLIELSRISGDAKYWAELIDLADSAGWTPRYREYHADDHAVGHAYLETYMVDKSQKERFEPFKKHFDKIIEDSKSEKYKHRSGHNSPIRSWDWCDALFMAPPTVLKLYKITGDKKYLDYMNDEYKWTYDVLYSPEDLLFFRDKRFITMQSPNGKKVFWGRGNGWVYGGLVQILNDLPKDIKERAFYEKLFVDMSKKILSAQQSDGLWRANLDDPKHYEGGETSASGFLTYGMAWGINSGLLDKKTYEKPVLKAWKGLLTRIQDSGKVGYVQKVGDKPDSFDKDSTQAYGIGVVLLAGTEIAKMLGAKQEVSDEKLLKEAQNLVDNTSKKVKIHRQHFKDFFVEFKNENLEFKTYSIDKSNSNNDIEILQNNKVIANLVEGIYKDGKIYKPKGYTYATTIWTKPENILLRLYYIYDVEGKAYMQVKDITLAQGKDYCTVDSYFMNGVFETLPWRLVGAVKGAKDKGDIEMAVGLNPNIKEIEIDFVKSAEAKKEKIGNNTYTITKPVKGNLQYKLKLNK